MNSNPFVWPSEKYQRNINVLASYVEDSARYIHQMTGQPMDVCTSFIRSNLKSTGLFPFKDPTVSLMERKENGDRQEVESTLFTYLAESIRDKELIAPTFTTYLSPEVKKSVLVDFIDGNVEGRSKAKKEMFAAKKAKDDFLFAFKKGEQTGRKLSNNALSGAHVSASTPLYNKTAHSTLTSNCRNTSGYGNANNEKFLCGNRHYWSPEIVRNNIISIINHSDLPAIQSVVDKYSLCHPTVEQTMECVVTSTKLYWQSEYETKRIRLLIETLKDVERSAFVYTGDMYHLMLFNRSVIHEFIDKLSTRVDAQHPDPAAVIKKSTDDQRSLAVQLCPNELKGSGVDKLEGTPALGIFASTLQNVQDVIKQYSDLIAAFWVTDNVPASLAHFPTSIRHSAITSDTDSTIFTVQDWVLWHQGKIAFDDKAMGVAAAVIFLASQTITHVLARMSANFGIEQKRLNQIAMKNEFKFDVFVATQVAKHYFALIGCQEGILFKEFETEIKGVHLKSSNAPKEVTAKAKDMMVSIMETVVAGENIELTKILKEIADLERSVDASVRRGSFEYFRRGQIKTPASYVDAEMAAPYQQYLMWNEVFAPKYGNSGAPPYMTIKLSTKLDSPAATAEWLLSMKDKELADRMKNWINKSSKNHVGSTFTVPEQCAMSNGIPVEILDAVNVRGIVSDTTKVFYIILETLGMYMSNKRQTRLVSDTY